MDNVSKSCEFPSSFLLINIQITMRVTFFWSNGFDQQMYDRRLVQFNSTPELPALPQALIYEQFRQAVLANMKGAAAPVNPVISILIQRKTLRICLCLNLEKEKNGLKLPWRIDFCPIVTSFQEQSMKGPPRALWVPEDGIEVVVYILQPTL